MLKNNQYYERALYANETKTKCPSDPRKYILTVIGRCVVATRSVSRRDGYPSAVIGQRVVATGNPTL